jgi:hypothetical protein
MPPDLRPTAEAVRVCVERYGSIAHLADAIGVTQAQLQAWLAGTDPVPLESYIKMLDVLATKRP